MIKRHLQQKNKLLSDDPGYAALRSVPRVWPKGQAEHRKQLLQSAQRNATPDRHRARLDTEHGDKHARRQDLWNATGNLWKTIVAVTPVVAEEIWSTHCNAWPVQLESALRVSSFQAFGEPSSFAQIGTQELREVLRANFREMMLVLIR